MRNLSFSTPKSARATLTLLGVLLACTAGSYTVYAAVAKRAPKLTISVANGSQTLAPGAGAVYQVKLGRRNFRGPIKVRILGKAPAGVTTTLVDAKGRRLPAVRRYALRAFKHRAQWYLLKSTQTRVYVVLKTTAGTVADGSYELRFSGVALSASATSSKGLKLKIGRPAKTTEPTSPVGGQGIVVGPPATEAPATPAGQSPVTGAGTTTTAPSTTTTPATTTSTAPTTTTTPTTTTPAGGGGGGGGTPAGPITVSATPSTQTVASGTNAVYALTASTNTTFSIDGTLPTGVTASFSPNPSAAGTATLTLSSSDVTTDDGTYTITVRVTRPDATTATTTITLVVATPPGDMPLSGSATNLFPGATKPLDVTITNPNSFPISVTALDVQMTSITGPNITASRPCTIDGADPDYAVTQFSGGYPFSLPPGTSSLSQLGFAGTTWPQITMFNRDAIQDGCKSSTITLTFSGDARKEATP